ncbi:uncharacterized protein [Paramormyrops kingsleyae]|uniref:uncharacterized protein isoform X2 n=1 Tax=Paramormyrops kingsleyae TaxID=1676925 RepID=UPI003B979A77
MTKLQLLNDYLTERLMAAVREILEVVGSTVLEYEEESARAQREIELLRRRLRDAGAEAPVWPASQPIENLEPEAVSPTEPELDGQDWSLQREISPSEEKLCVGQRQQEASMQCLPFTPPGLKSDHDQDSELPELFKVQIESPTEEPHVADMEPDLVKKEADGPSYSESQQRADSVWASDSRAQMREPPSVNLRQLPGKRTHSCPQCGKTFCHMSRLKIHLRIHTGEKPYSCSLCGKRFNNDGTLKNHQRVHTQVRLYSCTQCGMRFKDAYTCKKHQKVHTGLQSYCCPLCGLQLNDAASLQNHQRIHMEERPYCCTFCGKQFMALGKLNKHLKSHSRETTYS